MAVFVAGADGYLGATLVKHFVARGHQVIASCFSQQSLDRMRAEINSSAVEWLICDLSQESQVAKLGLADKPITACINAVGGFHFTEVMTATTAQIDFLLNVNFKSSWHIAKYVIPGMIQRNFGRMVFVSAAVTKTEAGYGLGPYAASKAALNSLVESLCQEVKAFDIGINVILPTTIDTPRNRQDMPDADFSKWVPATQLHRMIDFLIDKDTTAVHGAFIKVAGRM